jgi:deoxyadenosine/deoxycytidine kinase
MRSKLIAFSGACNSGKTTAMQKAKARFGDTVTLMPEIIRQLALAPAKVQIESLSNLRKNPTAYLLVEDDIIRRKIQQECDAMQNSGKVYLIDRSVVDSLFYLIFYLDKSNLSSQELRLFRALYDMVINALTLWLQYDAILFFLPLNIETNDLFRPNMDIYQKMECDIIGMMTLWYCHQIKDARISSTQLRTVTALDESTYMNTIEQIIQQNV